MNKYGKKTVYVNTDIFASNVLEDNFNPDSEFKQINDGIRYYSKNFWINNQNKIIPATESDQEAMLAIESTDDDTIILKANKEKFTSDIINSSGILERNFDKFKWESFIKNIVPDDTDVFEDFYMDFYSPINLDEIKQSIEPNLNFINSEFIYNFSSPKYENLTSPVGFDITTLPSMLSVLKDRKLDIKSYEENLSLTLGGFIPDVYAQSLYLSRDINEQVKKYFDVYASAYKDPDASQVIRTLSDKNFNLEVTDSLVGSLQKISFVPFPFYSNIKFSNECNSQDNLIHNLYKIGNVVDDLLFSLKVKNENVENTQLISDNQFLQQLNINTVNFKNWIDTQLNGYKNEGTADGVVIFDDTYRPYKQIEYTNLINYLKVNVKNKTRKYEELFNKSCHNEILIYKIEKKQLNISNAPIQTFWIQPNQSEIINFIDTQIKYGTEYFYTISAYVFALGNEYSYKQYDYSTNTLLKPKDISEGLFRVRVQNKPVYKIFEIPIANIKGAVHEQPYTKPIVDINKDINSNSIRISLLESAEQSYEKLEIIENRDFKIFNAIAASQKNEDEDKIYCKNAKDEVVELQIYKTTILPTNYLSFQNKLYKTLPILNENSFKDEIVPNIKYYYVFRYINVHGTPSNASDVYEVELKDEDGYYYLSKKKLDLKKQAKKIQYKDMKRYLLIRPSIIQTQVKDRQNITTVDDVFMGPLDDSVWDKDFILRIKSKKTNRILEFDFKYTIYRKKD